MKKFFFSVSIILFIITVTFAQEKRTDEKVETQKIAQTDRPLKIIKIPKPKYPVADGGSVCITGNVRLRVEFLASGKTGKISPISELGYGATENAIEAARNIKFEPAVKDGKTVTVHKVIVINFSIY